MAINGTCEATLTRPQNSYPILARGLEGFNTSRPSRPPRRSSTTATAPGSISGRCATPATSRPRRPRPSQWSFTTGAATTSTSCCATSPRWALLSAGHRAKSSERTATTRAARARRKEAAASPRGPCPRPRQSPRPRPRQSPSPPNALQAAIKQGDYSYLCLRVLCKSGEKCLEMSGVR